MLQTYNADTSITGLWKQFLDHQNESVYESPANYLSFPGFYMTRLPFKREMYKTIRN